VHGQRLPTVALLGVVASMTAACDAPRPPATTTLEPPSVAVVITTPPPPPVRPAVDLTVLIGGDLLPHRPMLLSPERLRNGLAPLETLLGSADVAVANYETSTGGTDRFKGEHNMSLAVSPEWLAEVGKTFHALTIANNHACDLGRAGLSATLVAAEKAGVTALGGDLAGEPWKARVIDEKDGRTVCAVAWTTFVNAEGKACKGSGELAMAASDKKGRSVIEAAVARARKDGCDGVVAIVHGGIEYVGPDIGVREQAAAAAEAGADAVVIHHPHVPAPAEVIVTKDGRRVVVFTSVGNLLSNQGESYELQNFPVSSNHLIAQNAWTRLGVLADLRWSWPAGATKSERPTVSYAYHLTWTDNDHVEHRADPMPHISTRPLNPTADETLIRRLERDTSGPVRLFSDPCWVEASRARCVVGEPLAPSIAAM
jgi:Bacterial capsule synthesis protein PGA_cap